MFSKIIKIEYTESMPYDKNGEHATGRVIVVQYLEDSYCQPKGSKQEWYEYENDWTADYDDEELIGMEY